MPRPWLHKTHAETIRWRGSAARNSKAFETLERLSDKPLITHNAERFIPLRRIAQAAAREAERKIILQLLEANSGNRKKAARALNLSYRALLYKIRGAGIPPKRLLVPHAAPRPSQPEC
jgi:DNA-binding NtrC family response regulator